MEMWIHEDFPNRNRALIVIIKVEEFSNGNAIQKKTIGMPINTVVISTAPQKIQS